RILSGCGFQLSDTSRGLQGGRSKRSKQIVSKRRRRRGNQRTPLVIASDSIATSGGARQFRSLFVHVRPNEQAIRDAGIERPWPLRIPVGTTIVALLPLASHGGPLWKPLCYAQIGGLAVATFITLLLVPVFYSIALLDLTIVKWETAR